MEKFWMILVDGTEFCRVKHPSLEEAMIEAERLAGSITCAGRGATILKAVWYGSPKPVVPPLTWNEIKE